MNFSEGNDWGLSCELSAGFSDEIPLSEKPANKSLTKRGLLNGRQTTSDDSLEAGAAELQRLSGPSHSSWTGGAKVLIVDSDTRSVHELAMALRHEGYVTFEATSFADAKRLWVSESPHVLVADICLGQFNGLQLLMQAREEKPDVNAVITCAFADVVLEAEARRFGGVFLVKPLEPRQILAAIGTPSARRPATKAMSFRPERRREERRKTANRHFAPDRRVQERRSNGALNARRAEDRRQLVIPNYFPERRNGERRGSQDSFSTA